MIVYSYKTKSNQSRSRTQWNPPYDHSVNTTTSLLWQLSLWPGKIYVTLSDKKYFVNATKDHIMKSDGVYSLCNQPGWYDNPWKTFRQLIEWWNKSWETLLWNSVTCISDRCLERSFPQTFWMIRCTSKRNGNKNWQIMTSINHPRNSTLPS